MQAKQLTVKLKEYMLSQVDTMGKNNPMISFAKPLIKRAIDNKFDGAEKMLSLIADKDGNIDVASIMDEMIQSLVNTNPFTLNNSLVGNIEIGGGLIKLDLPFTSKRLVFNQDDIELLKESLISNSK